jgi:hypothetical protein
MEGQLTKARFQQLDAAKLAAMGHGEAIGS